MNTCIEYDGIQHFKPIKYFGGEKALEIQRSRDIIKNEYCYLKNIQIIRISYLDNTKEKVEKTLNQLVYE